MNNPFKFTDRTYNTLLTAINSVPELADKPEWFKRMIAGLGDVFSVITDGVANDSLLPTALTRESTQALLKLIDYEIGLATTATGTQIFNVKKTTPNGTTFNTSDLIASTQGNLAVSSLRYQARASVEYNKSITNFIRSSSTVFTTTFDYLYTGKKVQLVTTGTLPAGLALNTDYFIVYIDSTSFSLALSIEDAFNNILVSTTDVGTGTHTVELYSFDSVLYQQTEKPSVVIGQSDGVTSFQEFSLPDSFVLTDTLIITIGGDTYTEVTTLVDSEPTDKVFKILNKENGFIALMFGNNEFGNIPPIADIQASYSVGGGSLSNNTVLNSINVYSGSNSEIESTTNGVVYTGGADEESIANAKIRAPILLKARNRFVTTEDGEILALALGGLSYVDVIRNAFGVLTVNVLAIANGGGNPSTAKKQEIDDELTNKSILESVAVTVSDATLTAPTVTTNIKKITGFTFADIEEHVTLGLKLFFTETGREIYAEFISEGITDAITLINVLFGTSYDNNDSTWISSLLTPLDPVSFGQTINESDIVSYIKSNVSGIDDITFSSPTFPLVLAATEITTHTGIIITINEV
jgi:hypothetical protein